MATKCYSEYAVNEMAGNFYTTYKTDEYVLNAIFKKSDKTTRMIVESLSVTALPGLESEDVIKRSAQLSSHTLYGWVFASNVNKSFNTISIVCRWTIEGQTIMMLADCTEAVSILLCELYGSYLKSDFVQIAHHGYHGGTTPLYKNIDATNVLWPMGMYHYEVRDYKSDPRADYLHNSPNVKGLYVAAELIRIFPMPFTGEGIISTNG